MANPEKRKSIEGKHVVVLDDYTTCGYSLETARRILLQAGARKVTCVAIGKWRKEQVVTRIARDWDPYRPCTLTEQDINVVFENGNSFSSADYDFNRTLDYLSQN